MNSGTWYYRADRPDPPANNRPGGDVSIVTPGYFRALGIPIMKGRDFVDADRIGSTQVAILNQTAARMLFPGEEPLGKRIKVWGTNSPTVEVVGVVADIRHTQLNSAPDPCLFMPNDQQPFPFSALVIRSNSDPIALAKAIRRQIREVDRDQGVAKVETLTELVAGSIARPRIEAFVLTGFGVIALLLACIGIYGVVAFSVTRRFREIGIRLALGATSVSVFRMVLEDGFRLTLVGLAAGLTGVLALASFLAVSFLRSSRAIQ